jgi:uncharacterized protein YjgD (DUF1641 family)
MDQTTVDLNQVLVDLNQKMDVLSAQVAYLTEQARLAEQGRQTRNELIEDVMPIARDVMEGASVQLQDVQEYIAPEDLFRLLKKVARHRAQFEMLVDQIDTVTDLLEVMGPMSREMMDKATEVLQTLEQKGYFAFAKQGLQMADNVVTSFTEDDVKKLSDNIVLILNTVKEMTQPDIMQFVRNTLLVAGEEVEKPVDISYLALLNLMRDPAVRRGLAITMRVLRTIGAQPGDKAAK